ncbi:hypothetical protein [Actinomadura sp. 9N215]|uniref:hypothetical protein n=1 Tax=Actinomadura sp. 9N215 TaxID=3375150 RepID=UPI0037B66366
MIITLKDCLVPECAGKEHRWEFERPTLRELERIEHTTGMDVGDFFQGLVDVEEKGVTGLAIKTLLAMVDVLHRREGIRPPFEDIDVDFVNLSFEFMPGETEGEGEAGEAEGGEGKDPAPAAPSHPQEEPATPAAEPGSGPEAAEASEPRSSTTPTGSGGGSASP